MSELKYKYQKQLDNFWNDFETLSFFLEKDFLKSKDNSYSLLLLFEIENVFKYYKNYTEDFLVFFDAIGYFLEKYYDNEDFDKIVWKFLIIQGLMEFVILWTIFDSKDVEKDYKKLQIINWKTHISQWVNKVLEFLKNPNELEKSWELFTYIKKKFNIDIWINYFDPISINIEKSYLTWVTISVFEWFENYEKVLNKKKFLFF